MNAWNWALSIIRRLQPRRPPNSKNNDSVIQDSQTDSYLPKWQNQLECQICHSPLTVKHILIDCICFSAARQRYRGVDTLKELSENVESRYIVAFIKDTNFYHCIWCCFYINLIALISPSFYLFFYHIYWIILTIYGTGWPILCWCATNKILAHSLSLFHINVQPYKPSMY